MFKVYRVNSRTGEIRSEEFKKDYHFFGNRGLVAKVMSDEVNPECDPMGAENKLIVCTGLLAGSAFPAAHRLSVGGKSPLTGTIKESSVGGTVGTLLSQHGIKMFIIEDKPVEEKWHLLKVNKNGDVELLPADEYSGLNNYSLLEKLHKRYGKEIAVLSVGTAGERGYRNSSLQSTDYSTGHPSRSAARGGLGAVAGSKKIKAIVIEKALKKMEMEYADRDKFSKAQKRFIDMTLSSNNKMARNLVTYGTVQIIDDTSVAGIMPVRNFTGDYSEPKKLRHIKSGAWLKKMKKNKGKTGIPCQAGCIIRCSNIYRDAKGEFVTAGLEYETAALAGPNCDIYDWDYLAEFDRRCDDLGVDTIETGSTIAVCMEAGKIPWGDKKAAMGLLKEMAEGTEFGRLMGQGTEAVGQKLGVKRIPTCKGQSLAAYDPRNLKGTGVTYAMSPMGADHTAGVTLFPGLDGSNKAAQVSLSGMVQAFFAAVDNLMCIFAMGSLMGDSTIATGLLSGLYGGQWNMGRLLGIGIQTIAMERSFNRGAGFTEKDDYLPEFFYKEFSPATGAVFDISPEEMAAVFNY